MPDITQSCNSISDLIQGSKGSTNCENTIYIPDGSVKWTFDYPEKEVSWDEMMNSDLYLGPKTYVIEPVTVSKEIPKPGSSPK
ncbi:hypothetical protein [Labilibaculum euxinus]